MEGKSVSLGGFTRDFWSSGSSGGIPGPHGLQTRAGWASPFPALESEHSFEEGGLGGCFGGDWEGGEGVSNSAGSI